MQLYAWVRYRTAYAGNDARADELGKLTVIQLDTRMSLPRQDDQLQQFS